MSKSLGQVNEDAFVEAYDTASMGPGSDTAPAWQAAAEAVVDAWAADSTKSQFQEAMSPLGVEIGIRHTLSSTGQNRHAYLRITKGWSGVAEIALYRDTGKQIIDAIESALDLLPCGEEGMKPDGL